MTVGLIGCGNFGRLAARLMARRVKVIVHDRRRGRTARLPRNVFRGSVADAAAQPVVVLAVPVSELRGALRAIRGHVRPGALIVDVCGVKTQPVRWMKRILPRSVSLIGTHPLWGPSSVSLDSTVSRPLADCRIVFCPVRVQKRRLHEAVRMVRSEGARVTIMTPRQHDRMVAETLLLTQFVGRCIGNLALPRWRHSTAAYERLMEVVDIAMRDDPLLFTDLWRYNPYARSVKKKLDTSIRDLRRALRR